MADQTITLRKQDEYMEGMTWGKTIFTQLSKHAWLRPGVTYQLLPLNGAGRVMITKVTKGTIQKPVALCEEGTPNKATGSLVEVKLDKSVPGVFNGCFTVANLVPETWRNSIDKGTVMMMGISFQTDVEEELVKAVKESTIDRGELIPSQYLLRLKSEFFSNSGRQARAALVSSSFYAELIGQNTNLATNSADFAFINGAVGRVSGLEIIETDMTEDVILIAEDSINIPVMSSMKDIPSLAGTNLEVDLGDFGPQVSGGFISKIDINAKSIPSYTYVHFPYGVTIIPELTLKSKASGGGTPS